MTIADTAVGPTSPITPTNPVQTGVTGPTNAIIATGLINGGTGAPRGPGRTAAR